MASGNSERSSEWVMPGDPRQRVDKRLMTVDTLEEEEEDAVAAPPEAAAVAKAEADP
jgi:hypothetical protein